MPFRRAEARLSNNDDPPGLRRALFTLSIHQHARELHPVVADLHARGIEVAVLLGWSGGAAEEYRATCEALGIRALSAPAALQYHAPDRDGSEPAAVTANARPSAAVRARRRIGLAAYSLLALARLVPQ